MVGLLIPALDAGATTFQIWVDSEERDSYRQGVASQIIDVGTGAAQTWTLGTTPGNPPQAIGADDLEVVSPFRFVKLYLSRSQTVSRTFYWIVKG